MNRRVFVLLMVLMSFSLVGIILVQAYYIDNSVKSKEEQFTFNVKKALTYTSNTIEQREYDKYVSELEDLLAIGIEPDSTAIRSLTVFRQNKESNEIIIYNNGILEENYKIPSFIDISLDSINFSRFTNKKEKRTIKKSEIDGSNAVSSELVFKKVVRMDRLDKEVFESNYRDKINNTPIHQRVDKNEIEQLLSKKLRDDGIDINFEFAIYANDLATKIQSDNFELAKNSTLGVPIFVDNKNESNFKLFINFPERKKFILSSLIGVILLSITFTSIIIISYFNAIYQLQKQRQISQIKTDFINNMTHEFKTPIATINLALDAIKNPMIISNEDKVKRYLRMIKDENKRMHAQVENVLRISKLDKNELNISKDRVKLHDLIKDAVAHVELIVEDRKGYIKEHLGAAKSSVLANETHFTNVIVNILDNAIKYSDEAPKIDIYTENVGNNILLKVKDQGNGMTKSVQKRVFEKFYREHTGDVHNVKGHGLGLAYVKKIVNDHQGYISVESEKGKGSTFTIKLPLIT